MDKAACETAIPLATTPRYHPERCHKATRAMRSGLEKEKGAALGNAGSPHGAEFQHEPEFRPLENVRDRGFVCDSCRDSMSDLPASSVRSNTTRRGNVPRTGNTLNALQRPPRPRR